GLHVESYFAGNYATHVEQILNELRLNSHIAVDDRNACIPRFGIDCAHSQDLRPAKNRIERRSQLMTERRQKLVFHAADALGLKPCRAFALQQQSPFFTARALIGNIGVRAEPEDDVSRRVAEWHGSREVPAEFPVESPEREGIFPRFSIGDAVLPLLEYARQFLQIMHRLPAPTFHPLGRRTAVVVPPLVVPEYPTVGLRHPSQLRN